LPAWDNFCAVGETGLASPVRVGMKSEDVIVLPPPELERQASDARWALVNRVLHSTTFEHCPKLRAFLEYVCRCSLEGDPAAAHDETATVAQRKELVQWAKGQLGRGAPVALV